MAGALWKPVTEAGAAFIDAVAAAPAETLLALDFDGTLAPMVPNPEDSRMHDGSAVALGRLGARVGQLAIITGRGVEKVRSLGALDGRPGLERIVVLGQYGVERYDAASGQIHLPEAGDGVAAAKRDLVGLLAELAAQGQPVAGVHLEDKGRAIGVHTRRADQPEEAFEVLGPLVAAVGERRGLHVEPGRSVIELRTSTLTKGDALRTLVAETGATVVAMIGDDLGDLPAFQLLEQLRDEGITTCAVVSASEEQPVLADVADVICAGPDGVAAWLKAVAERIGR